MKTFYIMISKNFMKDHPRAGQPTFFKEKIWAGQAETQFPEYKIPKEDVDYDWHEYYNAIPKIHTIRDNYDYWAWIAEEVNAGRGILSLRQWTKSPYNFARDGSKQKEFCRLTKMGIQKINIEPIIGVNVATNLSVGFDYNIYIDTKQYKKTQQLVLNDGLVPDDFRGWFKKPLVNGAIIHFTDFRYV